MTDSTIRIPRPKAKWTRAELGEWTAQHPVGTRVRYWPARNGAEFRDGTIRSEPWILGHGAPVVSISGTAGGVALDHITKLPWYEPRPGSPEAKAAGCMCPVDDNGHGRGLHGGDGMKYGWIVDDACPVHPRHAIPRKESNADAG